jgi:alpha-galactosidase
MKHRRLVRLVLPLLLALVPTFQIRALTNNLALTPPMGWNSWNHFGCNISETVIRGVASAMATNGMKAAGYQYINMDDCWQVSRDANGVIVADPVKFPSGIKSLADFIHSQGLKLGIYSDHGIVTCGGRPGAYGYEYVDANTYASWGVDYLKFDNCNLPAGDNPKADYFRMSDALQKSGRPLMFSICAWSFDSWMPISGNLWRTTGDINDSFASMVGNLGGNSPPAYFAGPGRWNDPDMLEVGNGGMSFTEDQAHFSLWCVVGAPLIAGNDLTGASAQTLSILTNAEPIAVDQDPAGEQGIQLASSSTNQIWFKPLGYDFSTKAVALFNPNTNATTITVNWTDIGLQSGAATVRNLWSHSNLGTFANSFTTNVPAHGVVMLKVVGTAPALPALGTNYLTDLQTAYTYVGWGTLVNNKSIGGGTLTLNGTTYAKGLGAHALSGIEYRLGGIASRFQADIGVDDEVGAHGTIVFQVLADGTKIYESPTMTGGGTHQSLNLDVTGVNRLTLGVYDADDGIAYDHADWAGAKVTVTNMVPATPPAPTGLSALAGSPIVLSWNATRSATNYNIKRSPSLGGTYTNLATSVLPTYTDYDVTIGNTYYYEVSAVGVFGEGPSSSPASATACIPPGVPGGLVTVVTNNQVQMSWSPVAGASSYNLARALGSTPFTVIAAGLAGTNYTDLTVTNGTTYYYVVTANNACGSSGQSAFVAGTPNLPPRSPFGLTAITGGKQVVLNWNTVAGAGGYNVKRATASGGPYPTVATNLLAPPWLDSGLSGGTTYYYAVSAINTAGEGTNSPYVAATPCDPTLPTCWAGQDIGSVGYVGSSSGCGSTFIVQGGGADIWGNADAFQLVHKSLSGDSSAVARVTLLENTDGWAKGGVMYRNDTTAGSMYVDMIASAGNGVSLQWRATTGGGCNAINVGGLAAPVWVKLTRSGTNFTGYYSPDGANWTVVGTAGVSLSNTARAGLAVTAHNNAYLCLAAFNNVIVAPVSPNLSFATSTNHILLAWPASASSFSLWSATNLAPPITWSAVTNAPVSINMQWVVNLPLSDATRFFRLVSP